MKIMHKLFIFLCLCVVLFGCSSEEAQSTENGEDTSNQKTGNNELTDLNLYEEHDGVTVEPLTDVEHNHYPHQEILTENFVAYLDEDVALAQRESTAWAMNWKTGEPVWEPNGYLRSSAYSEFNAYDKKLYYKEEDEYKTIGISLKPEENTTADISEEEYLQHVSRYQSENTSYMVDSETSEDHVILEAYDKESSELLWSTPLPEIESILDGVEVLDNYVHVGGGRIPYLYILDKETGDILYEEKGYYTAGLQVEDTIYFVKQLTNHTFTFYKLATDTWELTELSTFEDVDHDYEYGRYLEYTDGILTYHMAFGTIGIDTSTGEPYINYYYDDDEGFGNDYVYTFIHGNNFYLLSSSVDHTVLSILDIQSKELLKQYQLDEEVIDMASTVSDVYKVLDNDRFVIITKEDGIYEFELAAFE
ncbi:hypothetical protein SH601_13645 [Gracilibacillus sp. S3-1-1]|uniref:Uncharacterized protein n=1 Tax=Gracilibacillus pellucidus TaxID=3095368 RepID=A0ACC6M866_9BACI|nr:hypothetical protein [Gracilibacillus sp. S3-1-1]MDX8047032.1 hypothetical protein [Gracilibacillus sp. S3-1-1]